MRLEARKYLSDIQVALERIKRFTGGKGFEEYLADELLRSAVERQLGIVGEALARLSQDSPSLAVQIPEHRKIIAFRNASLADAVDKLLGTP
jgi:uncharacterized protein with HEPN domain